MICYTISKKILYTISLLFFFCVVRPQENNYSIEHFNTSTGLKSNRTVRVVEDKYGFYWFGSIKGIQRFDGYEYREFPVLTEKGEISNTFEVFKLFFTPDSVLLVGTSIGLLQFDELNNYFKKIPFPKENDDYRVTDICTINDSTFFANSHSPKGVFVYKKNIGIMEHARSRNDSLMKSPLVRLVLKGPGTTYFFHISYHLYRYDITKDEFCKCNTDAISPATYFHYGLTDNAGDFWLLSGLGLYYMPLGGTLTRVTSIDAYCSLDKQIGRSIIQVTDSSLLIGFDWWGVMEISKKTKKVLKIIRKTNTTLTQLLSNKVYTLYKAKDKSLWWSSDGVYRISENIYDKQFIITDRTEETMNYSVLCFLEDSRGTIWVGTDGGGLHIYSYKENKTLPVGQISKYNLPQSKVITCLFEDNSENELWIGTFGDGLYVYNYKTNTLKHYKYQQGDTNTVQNNNIWWIFKDVLGNIVTTSYCKSVNIFNKRKNNWKHLSEENGILRGNCVTAVAKDTDGEIWFAYTEEGIDCYDEYNQRMKNNILRSRDRVFSICFHGDTVFLGCFNGLVVYSKKNNSFINHPISSFFDKVKIYSIFKDSFNRFWVASENGLYYFEANERKPTYSIHNNFFGENIAKTITETKNKVLLFGGINGLLSVPTDKAPNSVIYDFNIFLTDFKLFGKSFSLTDKYGNLKLINELNYIKLPYNKNYIELSFSVLNLEITHNIEYKYKVENFYPNWQTLQTGKNKIELPGLQPGSYTIEIKAIQKSNDLNYKTRKFTIEIAPPFWKSWWFRTLFVVVIMLLMLLYVVLKTRYLKIQKQKLELLVEERTGHINKQKQEIAIQAETLEDQYKALVENQEELQNTIEALEISNSSKNKLFSIISHDLKSPIYGLSGLLKIIVAKFDTMNKEKLKTYIESGVEAVNNIEVLLENLLQWSKAQQNSITITPETLNVLELINKAIAPLLLPINNKMLHLEVKVDKNLVVFADEDTTVTIIRNLVQNAIKFSDKYGRIILWANHDASYIYIHVQDNGI
ncbi:MAG: two-component regulator propeller domain-containing protein, partial [Bacteroidales bacterium]